MNKENSLENLPVKSITFLESSLIREAEWDPFTQVLKITFTKDGIYDYIGVPQEIFEAMTKAPSVGKFFHQNIRGKFETMNRTKNKKKVKSSEPTK